MWILWALLVVVVGCAISYVAAIQLGAIGELAAGTTVGSGLRIIIGAGGIALTIALAISAAKATRKSSSP